jgi:antitoxin FitA
MAMRTIRNLPDNVHRTLRVRMGDALAELGDKIGLTNEHCEVFNQVRDKTPANL